MGRERRIDPKEIIHMLKAGASYEEVMVSVPCSFSTIRRAMDSTGYRKMETRKHQEDDQTQSEKRNCLIFIEDVYRYRDMLKIGSVVRLPSGDEKMRCQTGGKYVVVAKYQVFFIAVQGNHERHIQYVSMLMQGRKTK